MVVFLGKVTTSQCFRLRKGFRTVHTKQVDVLFVEQTATPEGSPTACLSTAVRSDMASELSKVPSFVPALPAPISDPCCWARFGFRMNASGSGCPEL